MKQDSRSTICGFCARRLAGAFALVILAGLVTPPFLVAHDSPEHVVEALTARIGEQGKSAELLWQRATEHRELGQLAAAAEDLREAVRLQPDFFAAHADLARVQLHLGKTADSLTSLRQALKAAPDEATRAPLYLTRAEVHAARGELDRAVADCDRAFAATPSPDAEWFLLRSQFQLRSGKAAEAAAGLKQGFEHTGSPVIEAEWIDALLDAGKAQTALDRIEPQLAESRLRASWLLRRARARLALGESITARGDLHAAISEIDSRLASIRPEPTLLADRGFALALLGDTDGARRALAASKKAGAESWVTWRLEARLKRK